MCHLTKVLRVYSVFQEEQHLHTAWFHFPQWSGSENWMWTGAVVGDVPYSTTRGRYYTACEKDQEAAERLFEP